MGLLPWRSLAWVCSLGLLPPTCSCRGHWLGPALTGVPVSGLLLQRLLSWAWFSGVCCLGPVSMEVAGLGLPWLRSLASWLFLHTSLAWAWSQGCWLRLAPSEVAPSLGSLARACSRRCPSWSCSCRGHWPGPASVEVTVSGLLQHISLKMSNTYHSLT